MIERPHHVAWVRRLLSEQPVVALLGARQVGKTTWHARSPELRGRRRVFDLESAANLAKLADPLLALEPLRGLVVLDEFSAALTFFRRCGCSRIVPVARALSGSRQRLAGTASADVGDAGGTDRFHHLDGLSLREVRQPRASDLWLRLFFDHVLFSIFSPRRISSLVCGPEPWAQACDGAVRNLVSTLPRT